MREGRASDRLGKKEVGLLSGHLGTLLATLHSSLSCPESDRSEQEIEESSLIDVN
jgi:hypothetical protein